MSEMQGKAIVVCLFLTVICQLTSPVLSIRHIICPVSNDFIQAFDTNANEVLDAELIVEYKRNNLSVYTYQDTDAVNLIIDGVDITFGGDAYTNTLGYFKTRLPKLKNLEAVGVAKFNKNSIFGGTLSECEVFFIEDPDYWNNVPSQNISKIMRLAEECISTRLCSQLGVVTDRDLARAKMHTYDFGPVSVLARRPSNGKELTPEPTTECSSRFQAMINAIVDIFIRVTIAEIEKKHEEKFTVANISEEFTTGSSFWLTTGNFDAYNGTFEDLSTLERIGDADLSRESLKFTLSGSLGLAMARLRYGHYKFRYGVLKFSGEMSITIDGLVINASIAVDYNQKPCRLILNHIEVSEYGKINVKLTGFGVINNFISRILTWVTTKWKESISALIIEKLKTDMDEELEQFNCEKYRP